MIRHLGSAVGVLLVAAMAAAAAENASWADVKAAPGPSPAAPAAKSAQGAVVFAYGDILPNVLPDGRLDILEEMDGYWYVETHPKVVVNGKVAKFSAQAKVFNASGKTQHYDSARLAADWPDYLIGACTFPLSELMAGDPDQAGWVVTTDFHSVVSSSGVQTLECFYRIK